LNRVVMAGSRQQRASRVTKTRVKKRMSYDQAFKLQVVHAALQRPTDNRIKPTCALFPGIEPCQLRKWIRNYEASQPPGCLGSKRPSSTNSQLSSKKHRRGGSASNNFTSPFNKSPIGVREKNSAHEHHKGRSEDGDESDSSMSDSNSEMSSPTSPTASDRSDTTVGLPGRVNVPLFPRRSAAITPDKSFGMAPYNFQSSSSPTKLLALHLEQSVCKPPKHPYNALASYNASSFGNPAFATSAYGPQSMYGSSAWKEPRAICPAVATGGITSGIFDEPVEEWVDEWLNEVASATSQKDLVCTM